MYNGSNAWYIPMADMEKTRRNRENKRCKVPNPKYEYSELFYCKTCNNVYQQSLYSDKRSTGGKYIQDTYSVDVMPKYGLVKKECLRCSN